VKALSDTLDTIGFIARSVDDVALFAAATTGDRGLLQLDVSHAPRIAMCHTHEWAHADEDTHKAFEHAARILALAGMPIRELQLPLLFSQLLQAQKEIMAFDVVRSLAHERLRHPHLLSDQLNQVINIGLEIPVERHYANLQLAQSARGMVSNAFGAFEVLLAPSAIGEAPDTLSQTGDPVFSRVWTLLGLPCVHVPFFKGHSGMPVGLQVVGRHGEDKVVLRVAKWLMERMALT
jgi:Asp-tRNA(Asn)/Glu-tRNA(Gln) amidotransferase A subunit family amidase